jgi:anti-sigma regulatory factor (Ser/Thr protein kinase)
MADPKPSSLRVEVSSDPRVLGIIRGVLQVWLGLVGLAAERRAEVVLAVDEACSNCIRHAYGGQVDGAVELCFSSTDDWLEIVVSDRGTPCPTECAEYRPLEAPDPERLQPGGLGVRLIHEVFDEVQFCRGTKSGNCVTMRLHR